MPQIDSIDPPYFLTRQTANLQEDFGREIKKSASLFLLYGELGVGKTRLLTEMALSRLNELEMHWVDCKQSTDETNVSAELGSTLERILAIATIGDVIVADHFELASKKIKHQLLQSWSTDGIDKKFSLIIATDQAGLEEVRDLATRYRLKVESFQLLPLTSVEIDDYCASTLFPSLPPGPLSMPKQTRRALNETRGVVSQVCDVVDLHRNHITMKAQSNVSSIVKPLFVIFGLSLILMLAGFAYYFMPLALFDSLSFNKKQEEVVELTQPTDNLTSTVPKARVDGSQTSPILESKAMIQAPAIVEPVAPQPEFEPVAEPKREAELALVETMSSPLVKIEELSKTQIVAVGKVDIDKEPKVEPEQEDSVEDQRLIDIVAKGPYSDWFKAELTRSRDWFETRKRSRAAIQLMSISLDNKTDDTYLSYVQTLQKKGIDVSQLRVYPTRVREKILLSIIYGDYGSRRVANQSLTELPSSLRANQPISRSIGSIWNEISQGRF